MPYFQNAGIRLHFEVYGAGRPLVFLHGGTVNFQANYAVFGWPEKFITRGFQVIGLDFRGHGESDKPHEARSYGTANVTRLGELPKDREILVICRCAQRAYYATRILLQNGFKARVLSGGTLSRTLFLAA